MSERLEAIAAAASERFGDATVRAIYHRGELTLHAGVVQLLELLLWLRDEATPRFTMLVDMSGIDGIELGWKTRFRVSYHLVDPTTALWLRVQVSAPEGESGPELPTVAGLWESANWNEREIWDLMGIRFAGHPDLRRILMHEDYDLGHPLQKQIPTRGLHDDNR
jgi:NADH-quinone oxidoreductase subunit C